MEDDRDRSRERLGDGVHGCRCLASLAPFDHDWIGGDIRGLATLAGTLYGYVPALRGVTSTLDRRVAELVGACRWTGSAASAFEHAYEADAQAARDLSALVADTAEIIDALAVALSRIESGLEQAAATARRHGAPIGADGAAPQICLAGTTPADREAAQWLEAYQRYYQECLAAAERVRAEAAAKLRGLPIPSVPAPGKGAGSGWETALVAIGTGIDDVVGAGQGGISGVGAATSRASALLRAGDPAGGRVMSLLSHNSTWQELGELGRSDAVELGGRLLLGAGTVLTGIGVYQQTHNPGEAATDAVGDTAISWAATWGGMRLGMMAGGMVGS